MNYKITLLAAALLFFALPAFSQNDYAVREVKNGLYIPWEMVNAPDGTIWFTQRHGAIARLDPATGQMKQLHFEQEVVAQGEGGMLGFAMHPNFPATPEVFCAYNYSSGGNSLEKLVVYTYLPATDTLQYKTTIVDGIDASGIHNGSRLLIHNNKLFMTTGDAADQSHPQNRSSLNGKILRYNLDGSIPGDNPVSGSPLWSWGHRNPQGLAIMGSKLVSSEHGPSTDDEINIIEMGRNYGWPNVHGYCNTTAEISFCNDSNIYEPAITWTPTLAVSGIDYYTNPLFPQWQNKLLMATLKQQTLHVLTFNAAQDSVVAVDDIPQVSFGRLRDVLIAPNGMIYVSTSNSTSVANKTDKIYEIYDPTPTSVPGRQAASVQWQLSPVPATQQLTLTRRAGNGTAALQLIDLNGRVVKAAQLTQPQTTLDISGLPAGLYLVKLTEPGAVPVLLKFQKL